MIRLDNKVAIITGGGSGIGKAIAENLSESGAIVYIIDIQEDKGRETVNFLHGQGFKANFLHCDVSKQNQVSEVVNKIFTKESKIDILIGRAHV